MGLQLSANFRPDLGKEVIEMLEDFCIAHHESNATEVVRKAVRDFIPRDLLLNQGAKLIFDALQSKRRDAANIPSTAAKPDDGQRR